LTSHDNHDSGLIAIREAQIAPAESASRAFFTKNVVDDFLSKSLIALMTTVDTAQVGLAGLLMRSSPDVADSGC
jgi:hypothetical protein